MIPFNPLAVPSDVPRRYLVGRGIFMAGAFGMLIVVLVWFGTAMLAGGQFGPTDDVKWDAVAPWPIVSIPAWVVISLCVLPVVGAAILAGPVTWVQAPELLFLLFATVIFFILLPVGMSRMYPDPGGAPFDDAYPQLGLGQHWWGAVLQPVTLIILGIRFAMVAPRYNAEHRRLQKGAS
ncbi:hypothetical protein D9V29_05825 [Mycetocola manganoxydans]|uniref:Uncharacterized protein n=1 Tax=Mycetocola manganoxydans TaxID=699879 RepID=A0A3L6ZXS8_9MICO|nr:hypothetical protein [Mycetocola manganoxydans]RLP71952.1 hypothetical protein D9V29_05825 [Mycetocola manganoxydans]GHD47257.1 hypothetical protein GCM10008097_17970 [Mycetocola manganoxydans]